MDRTEGDSTSQEEHASPNSSGGSAATLTTLRMSSTQGGAPPLHAHDTQGSVPMGELGHQHVALPPECSRPEAVMFR